MTQPSHPDPAMPAATPLQPEDFDALDDMLEAVRAHEGQTPQWEFCEGFMAALICCRRPIPPAEYWPVLLETEGDVAALFADAAQFAAFTQLWHRRWAEIAAGLDADVESLDDERAYCPQVLDVRGAMAALTPEERAEAMAEATREAGEGEEAELPSFAQVWALGFMFAVESWPEEWFAPPKDKEAVRWLEEAMSALALLCEDDAGPPEVSAFELEDGSDGPPSMSAARLEAFGEAVWAVYDLREFGRSLGPRVETVRRAAVPGRNDLCHCGSGKKYKKCHGAS